jgi:hypothetical protein
LTFALADDPTFTLNVSAKFIWKYCKGQRVRLPQVCIKYFIITGVGYA